MGGKGLIGLAIVGFLGAGLGFAYAHRQPPTPEFTSGRAVNQHFVDSNRWDAIRGDGCDMLTERGESLGLETIALMVKRQAKATDQAAREAAIEIIETCQRGKGWLNSGAEVAPAPAPAPAAPTPTIVVVNPATPSPVRTVDPRAANPEIYYGSQTPTLPRAFGPATMLKPVWKTIAAKDAANCRVMPSLDHEVVRQFAPGAQVLVNASAKGFLYNPVARCWIHASQF